MATTDKKLTREDRREAARIEAERVRALHARKEKRNRLILVGAIVAVIALIAVAAFLISRQSSRTYIEDVADVPANSNIHGGISTGADGAAGTVNEGAPTIQLYLDFMCSHCIDFEATNGADLTELREAGDLTVVYHPVSVVASGPEGASTQSAVAAATVADQSPEVFVDFVDAVFAAQATGSQELTFPVLAQIAAQAGVPEPTIEAFTAGAYEEWVDAATQQMGRDVPRIATPYILLEGEESTADWTQPGALRAEIEALAG